MGELRAAIFGFGYAASEHRKGYDAANGARLVAIADQTAERLKALEGTDVTAFQDVDELLRTIRPEIVSICTPPSTHAKLTAKALAAGAHVLCEKPLAHNLSDARRMLDSARQAKRILGVAFCHRFVPAIRKLRSLIESSAIGTPLLYRNQFSARFEGVEKTWFSKPELSGGGTLMDTTVHSVDLFRFLIGEVNAVRALASTTRPGLTVEDTSIVLVRSASGCIGSLEASWNVAPGTFLIEVRGTEGEFIYDYETLRRRGAAETSWREEAVDAPMGVRFCGEIQHFIDAVNGNAEMELDAMEGLRSLEILEDAYTDLRRP
ncbi:MAG: Gfo/Idh/MocA family protein [Candidatus Sumerlaeaceae bacterium]